MNELPYLQSERHFRLYEDYIFRIVNNWPRLTHFDPKHPHASVETLSTRIRMCMHSLRNNQWDTKIPFAKFIQIVDEIVVSVAAVPGKVTCGPRDLLRKAVPLTEPVEAPDEELVPAINLKDPSDDLLTAIVVLHHYRILISPSVLRTDKHSLLVDLKAKYDVEIDQQDDKYTII